MDKSSVIRQKGESQNECFKKTKHVKFSEKSVKIYIIDVWRGHSSVFIANFERITKFSL